MGFRQKYIKATGIKISSDIHIHHIDRDRSNSELSNLVHLPRLTHIRFHRLIDLVNQIDFNLKNNGFAISDLINHRYIYMSVVMFVPMKNWANKILNLEKSIHKKILTRNRLIGITIENELITKRQRDIIEACLKY